MRVRVKGSHGERWVRHEGDEGVGRLHVLEERQDARRARADRDAAAAVLDDYDVDLLEERGAADVDARRLEQAADLRRLRRIAAAAGGGGRRRRRRDVLRGHERRGRPGADRR